MLGVNINHKMINAKHTLPIEDEFIPDHRDILLTNQSPIDVWQKLVREENDPIRIEQALRQIFKSNVPSIAEIIFTSFCAFKCQHCIYPADYSKFNPLLSFEQWTGIITNLYNELNMRTFICNGRSIDRTSVEVLKWTRQTIPDAKIGIIDNGISIIPYLDDLKAIQPDWIDISIDGMEKEHDIQRNRKGAFNQTLETVTYLKGNKLVPKINVLSCLTNINRDSIINMISFLNKKGFKNFFIAPVSTFKDYGPSEKLRVAGKDFISFIHELHTALKSLHDTWIEVNIFDAKYASDMERFNNNLWHRFKPEHDHLTWNDTCGDNELHINYFPVSLSGISEFIVNSNGDVLLPNTMRKEQIPKEEIIGNLLKESPKKVIKNLYELNVPYFAKLLAGEQCILKDNK